MSCHNTHFVINSLEFWRREIKKMIQRYLRESGLKQWLRLHLSGIVMDTLFQASTQCSTCTNAAVSRSSMLLTALSTSLQLAPTVSLWQRANAWARPVFSSCSELIRCVITFMMIIMKKTIINHYNCEHCFCRYDFNCLHITYIYTSYIQNIRDFVY